MTKKKTKRRTRNAGELNGQARLSWRDVTRIRSLHDDGTSQSDLARSYNVSVRTIYSIVKGLAWKR